MLKPATNSDDDPSFEDAPKTSSGNSAREKTKKSWHFTLQIGVKNAYHHIMSQQQRFYVLWNWILLQGKNEVLDICNGSKRKSILE